MQQFSEPAKVQGNGSAPRRVEWAAQEDAIAAFLRRWKITFKRNGYYHHWDATTDTGARLEFKASTWSYETGQWSFNIHRHGKLDESQVDFYVLRLESTGIAKAFLGQAAIHLVIPAPIGTPTIFITPRSLLTRYAKYFNQVEQIRNFKRENHV